MPTTTFFHLPDGKREKLMQAIRGELARVPFAQASVNRIVQAAGIPRGSFYQYFKDRHDMLGHVLQEYQCRLLDHAVRCLRESGGDLFAMFGSMLDFVLRFVAEEENNAFCQNLFADVQVNAGFYTCRNREERMRHYLSELAPLVNADLYDWRTPADFENMMDILTSLTRDAIVRTFADMSRAGQARNDYFLKLELLKRGFIKDKGDLR